MRKSDWTVLALNLFTAFVALICAVEGGDEAFVAFMFVSAMTAINVTFIVRRARERDPSPARRRNQTADEAELDARQVLELDARLERLEQAQADAERWRALVASGQVAGPAVDDDQEAHAAVRQPRANGQR